MCACSKSSRGRLAFEEDGVERAAVSSDNPRVSTEGKQCWHQRRLVTAPHTFN